MRSDKVQKWLFEAPEGSKAPEKGLRQQRLAFSASHRFYFLIYIIARQRSLAGLFVGIERVIKADTGQAGGAVGQNGDSGLGIFVIQDNQRRGREFRAVSPEVDVGMIDAECPVEDVVLPGLLELVAGFRGVWGDQVAGPPQQDQAVEDPQREQDQVPQQEQDHVRRPRGRWQRREQDFAHCDT